jgi:uncharacterized protein involved in exopolysaccharide biosynthesis
MLNTNQTSSQISFMDLLLIVWKRKILIVLIMILGVGSGYLYTIKAKKIYSFKTTFFLPTQGPQVGGYAALLGGDAPPSFGNYVLALIDSNRMQKAVIRDIKPLFPKEMSEEKIFKKLKLKTSVEAKKDKNGLYILTYEGPDSEIGVPLLLSYLNQIPQFNEELQLSQDRKVVTVLDVPIKPKLPSKPRKVFNMAVALIGSFFLGVGLVFLLEGITVFSAHVRNKE